MASWRRFALGAVAVAAIAAAALEAWSTPIHDDGQFAGVRIPVAGEGVWRYGTGDFSSIQPRVTKVADAAPSFRLGPVGKRSPSAALGRNPDGLVLRVKPVNQAPMRHREPD